MTDVQKMSGKVALGVYALYFMISGAGAVTPALAAFGVAFPDASAVTISLIQSLPSLTCIIGTLFMGAIAGKKISFKSAGIISLAIYLVFGVLPTFWNTSIGAILVARALVGFGMGCVAPLGAAVFLRMIADKDTRSTFLGRGGAVQQIGCVILTLLGGFLCNINWTYTFLAYALCLVALIVMIICFEEPPSVAESAKAEGAIDERATKVRIPGLAWFFIILFAVAQMVCSPTMMNFSILMANNVSGQDATTVAGIAGTLLSVFVLAGAVSSVFMDKFVKAFGKYTGLLCFIISAIGIFLISIAHSVPLFATGIFVLGFGWCLAIPFFNLECGNVTAAGGLAFVASLLMVAMNLGNFVASYWMGFLFGIVGENPALVLQIDAVIFVILGVIWLLVDFGNKAWKKDVAKIEKVG